MKKPTKEAMLEYSDLRDAEQFLRDAKGYLDFGIQNLQKKDFKATHHSMARVKECLHETSWRLRGKKIKNGARA